MAKDDGYSDLIAEGLDDLNERENYGSTGIKKEERRPVRKKPSGARYGLFSVIALLLLNALAAIYFAASSDSSKTREEADIELQKTYAEEPAFEGVKPLLKSSLSAKGAVQPADVRAQIDAIRATLPESYRGVWPESADFVSNGSGLTHRDTETNVD